jgi:hypothetical protein
MKVTKLNLGYRHYQRVTCDLSVEERLNSLVALIGVATEGNYICDVLEVMILLKPPIYLLFLTEPSDKESYMNAWS